jgi:demethylmenaquinone methyltransferase/2-methoxy-6-polyprenyl-1,4-benzoquinol methylase
MRSASEYRDTLLSASTLSAPAIERAMAALAPAEASSGLDAGCGIGIDVLRLAKAVGPNGHVTGIDVESEFLDEAERRAAQHGFADRVDFRRADLSALPFSDGRFDWIWCRDVLWGHSPPPSAALREFTRVVRTGGTVALLFWSSQVLLPGHPELETRLMQAFARTTPYTAAIPPDRHFMRALGWMREAGLCRLSARSYPVTLHAPFDAEMRDAVRCCLEMFFSGLEGHVPARDWSTIHRMLDPASSDFLPGHDDYCCLFTYTLFTGRVSEVPNHTLR